MTTAVTAKAASGMDTLPHAVSEILNASGSLRPAASSQLGKDGQLLQLRCLLDGLGPASEALLHSLGDTLREWVAWCLSPTQLVFCTAEQLALGLSTPLRLALLAVNLMHASIVHECTVFI